MDFPQSSDVEPEGLDDSIAPLPNASYEAEITGAEKKTSAKSGNDYCEVTWLVTSGKHAGRLVWDIMNLWYKSSDADKQAKTRNIAQKRLNEIGQAAGRILTNPGQLAGISAIIRTKVRQGSGEYGPQTAIVAVLPKPGAAQAAPTQATPSQHGSGEASASAPSWGQ